MPAITDDTRRLLRLISLVGWTSPPEGNKCGLRHPSTVARQTFEARHPLASARLHMMCAYYAGSVKHHSDAPKAREKAADTRDLPNFTLAAVTGAGDDVLAVLGAMVVQSLVIMDGANELALGRTWRDDVAATCWRILLDNREDRFEL